MVDKKRIKAIIQFRRGDADRWVEVNPILRPGEPGFEIDNGGLKIGDGTTPWQDLDYVNGQGGGIAALSNDLNATLTVGGIKSGKTYNKGTSLETILRELLNPVSNPTFVAPSASLKSNAARNIFGIDEPIGLIRFDLNFDQGKITPAYGTSGKRAGAPSYKIDGQEGQTVNIEMDTKLPIGEEQVIITGIVAYEEGEQPKNSIGEDYDAPLPSGEVTANLTFRRKPYIYSNKTGIFDRMPIEEYNASPIEIDIANGEHPNEATVALPSKALSIETWDAIEREWEDVSWEFIEEQITLDGKNYWKYTDNRGYEGGERRLKFVW